MCYNPVNRASFSETINLRGHMPRFTWQMNDFPSIYTLRNPINVCYNPGTVLDFLWRSIWRVTCLILPNKWMISHLSAEKSHKCVLKPSEQGLFFWDDWFEGHMPRFTWKMNVLLSIYTLRNPINVCYNPQNRLDFPRQSLWGVTGLGLLESWTFSHLSP